MANNININTDRKMNNTIINTGVRGADAPKVNIIDPKRVNDVTKHDGQNQIDKDILNRNPESVHNRFITAIKSTTALSENAKKIITSKLFIDSNIKSDPAMKILFEDFIETIEMTKEEAVELIKFQDEASSKFNGSFFSELRTLFNAGENREEFSEVIRNFLTAYDSFTSTEHIEKSILNSLNNIEKSLPDALREPFNNITNNMGNKVDLGVIKNEVIPFIGKYVSKMNDFGEVRDYTSQLFHNIIRLEAGEQVNLQKEFDSLVDFIVYNFNYDDKDVERLVDLFNDTYMKHEKEGNKQIEAFFKLISSGMEEGKEGTTVSVMGEAVKSLLLNQDPNVPLAHMFIPMQLDGKTIISEIWISKEYEEYDDKGKNNEKGQYVYKTYVTFDIQGLGYFETTINMIDSKVGIDLRIPKKLSEHINKIERDIEDIIDKNNIKVTSLSVSSVTNRRGFEEIFTNILERRTGINVTI